MLEGLRTGMGLDRKSALILFVLCIILACFTLYTVKAYIVAGFILEYEGETWWTSGPGGSLFPWPREPGWLAVLTKIDETDLFIYRYLVKSLVLVGLSILMWATTGLTIFRVWRKLR